MLAIVVVVGTLVISLVLAVTTGICWRILGDIIRLTFFSRNANNTANQCAKGRDNLSHRKILFYGLSILKAFGKHVIVGFNDVLTFVDGVTYQNAEEGNQKDKKQIRNPSH